MEEPPAEIEEIANIMREKGTLPRRFRAHISEWENKDVEMGKAASSSSLLFSLFRNDKGEKRNSAVVTAADDLCITAAAAWG